MERPADEDLEMLEMASADITLADMQQQVAQITLPTTAKRLSSSSPAGPKTRSKKNTGSVKTKGSNTSSAMAPPDSKGKKTDPKPSTSKGKGKAGQPETPRSLGALAMPRTSFELPGTPVVASAVSEEVDKLSVHSSRLTENVDELRSENRALHHMVSQLQADHSELLKEFTSMKKQIKTLDVRISKGATGNQPPLVDFTERRSRQTGNPAGKDGAPFTISGQPVSTAPKRAADPQSSEQMAEPTGWRRKKIL